MSKPRNYQTEAIIIKKTKLGEADRILSLYTPHLGKLQAVAKGVRRPRSKMSGHLELLTHSLVTLVRGKNIDTVIGTQTIDSFLPLKNDLSLASCALYVTEVLNQFSADGLENYPLFRLALDTLHRLCRDDNGELALRYFELHLLDEAGYRPQLERCVSCHAAVPDIASPFSPGAGGVLCPSCGQSQGFTYTLPAGARSLARRLQGSDYDSARMTGADPASLRQLEMVMRYYIRYLLEREIRSARWLDTIRGR